jgi:hypothetical protein
MLVGSFKDRSLSNLHVKKKIRRLSYAPFPRKGNQGYNNKNRALRNDHNTNRGTKKKTEERKTDTPSRKAIFLTGILPPSFGEHNLQKQKTTNPDQQTENKKKACLRNLKVNSHHNKN